MELVIGNKNYSSWSLRAWLLLAANDLLFEETEALYRSTRVSPQLCELRNLITVAYLIVKSAEFRKESRGLHFNTDHPDKAKLLQNIIL